MWGITVNNNAFISFSDVSVKTIKLKGDYVRIVLKTTELS